MAITPKSEDKYVEKCSTAQSFIRTEMSTYRIGTLEKISPHCVLVQLKFAPVTLTIDPFLVVISRFFSFVDFGGLLLIF